MQRHPEAVDDLGGGGEAAKGGFERVIFWARYRWLALDLAVRRAVLRLSRLVAAEPAM